jgi:hypothetical protein
MAFRLRSTPRVLAALFENMPQEWLESRPFDPFDRRGFRSLIEGRSTADLA